MPGTPASMYHQIFSIKPARRSHYVQHKGMACGANKGIKMIMGIGRGGGAKFVLTTYGNGVVSERMGRVRHFESSTDRGLKLHKMNLGILT